MHVRVCFSEEQEHEGEGGNQVAQQTRAQPGPGAPLAAWPTTDFSVTRRAQIWAFCS